MIVAVQVRGWEMASIWGGMFNFQSGSGSHSTGNSASFLNEFTKRQKMVKETRKRYIKQLENYIWSLKDKCDTVNTINEQMIQQYCRFMVLAEEVSRQLVDDKETLSQNAVENLVKQYQQFHKISLNLYKILKFDTINEELTAASSPFAALLKEEDDGDF